MAKRIGYLRVSTQEQSVDRQAVGLKDQCDEIHIEYVSAVARSRPVFEHVLKTLSAGDCLIVWDLDRAFRSVVDAVSTIDALEARGVGFRIINLHVDTTTPSGRFIITIMGALAEFERRIIAQRTREGIAAARKKGKRLGRPPKLSKRQITNARMRLEQHESKANIAADYGVATWTLTRALRRLQDRDIVL